VTAAAVVTAPGHEDADLATPSLARRTLRVFTGNKLALTGVVVLVLLLLFCYLGPLLHPTDQVHTDLYRANLPPGSPGHPLGTTDLGYDLLGRLMVAGRSSLEVGLAAGLLATLFGTVWGAVSGYFGGWTDAVMMRITDAALAIPAMFLLVVVAAIITPSEGVLIMIIAAVAWLSPARLVRARRSPCATGSTSRRCA
jgi:peptide/nickel transport system permease protein